MKKNLILLIFITMLGILMAKDNQQQIFPYKYETTVLGNGLKVILIPMGKSGLAAYHSIVRTGSRDEWEPGKSGFAHFFEHMMFRGTEKFPGRVYDSIVTSIGADANAYTSTDLTVYHLNFASEDLETVMMLEADRFQNLKYSKQQFQTEAGAVYGEYRKNRTSPWAVASEKLHDLAFDKHTYKHTTIGFEEDIKNMPNLYEYSLSFYDRYYRPENVVLLIVGDFDKAKTLDLIKKYYSNWKPGYVQPQITMEPPQSKPRSAQVNYEGKTLPILIMAYKSDAFDVSNKKFLSSILIADLAFGETSELYKKLVLKEQKVQMLTVSPSFSRDPKLFYIYAMIKKEENIQYVKDEILKAIEAIQENLVDEQKLIGLKRRNKYSFLMPLDNPKSVAGRLPMYITLTGGIDVIDGIYRNMESITPEDLREAAKYYFMPERGTEVILKGAK